jgi:hypothetical protein
MLPPHYREQEMSKRVRRPEDMSPDGSLELYWCEDGDVAVTVRESGEKGFGQSVEFCNSGGHSHETLKALYALFRAMEKDNQ